MFDIPKVMKQMDNYNVPVKLWNDLVNVNFPANYNADGMVVPHPTVQKLTTATAQLGARFVQLAFSKLNDS